MDTLFHFWFGIGVLQRGFIVWQSSFVPIVINSYYGMKNVDPVYIENAKVLGFSDWEIFTKITFQPVCRKFLPVL